MRKLGLLTAATALAAVMGMNGSAWAQVLYTFDDDLVAYWSFDDGLDPTNDDSGNTKLRMTLSSISRIERDEKISKENAST